MYDINELHLVLLEIANEIHRVCIKNNIDYSLSGGTLLGSIRHKGFIPWDDDFDIGMTRENYENFKKVMEKDLSDKFSYTSLENDDLYALPFMKIIKKNTMLRESNSPKKMKGSGIFVDIFPYDTVPESRLKKFRHRISTDLYFRLLLAKSNYNLELPRYSLKNYIYIFFKGVSFFCPRSFLINRLQKNSVRYEKYNSKSVTTIGGPYGYVKEMIPRKLFSKLELFDFETTQFYAFTDYQENLNYLYGDYMQFPPEEDQYNRHSYEFVNFNLNEKK